MMRIFAILFISLSVFAAASAQEKRSPVVINVDVANFKKAMDSLRNEVIVDLRTPDELAQGKIAGAIVIDFFGPDFESAIQALDKGKTYLLYCAGGGRSGETAELMEKMGFKKVYNLEPGFNGWVKKQMPVMR
jgi:rhodanese-related sulfurtransferase